MLEVLTQADMADTLRARAARLVMSSPFQRVVIGLILFNAVTLGLETSDSVMASWGGLLHTIDRVLLVLFTAELGLGIYAFRSRFFRDPWGLFDLVVVGISWVPESGPLAVLRALRVLRVLRLISVVPSLRRVVEAMLAALPGMGSIVLLMALIFYVFAVMAVELFGDAMEEQFGDLGAALFTLFQLMAMDDFGNVVRQAMEHSPHAWLFFIPFSIVATFVVLNLFIGDRGEHPGHARHAGKRRWPRRPGRHRRRAVRGTSRHAAPGGRDPRAARRGAGVARRAGAPGQLIPTRTPPPSIDGNPTLSRICNISCSFCRNTLIRVFRACLPVSPRRNVPPSRGRGQALCTRIRTAAWAARGCHEPPHPDRVHE
ncbi:ion transporter [Falsiroseomonas sp. HW251]|uniref:ion transporter n=1 Tax=Falsiroseomonas sp. HW251 TaxID=3390998 RepID=UPI003D31B96D